MQQSYHDEWMRIGEGMCEGRKLPSRKIEEISGKDGTRRRLRGFWTVDIWRYLGKEESKKARIFRVWVVMMPK